MTREFKSMKAGGSICNACSSLSASEGRTQKMHGHARTAQSVLACHVKCCSREKRHRVCLSVPHLSSCVGFFSSRVDQVLSDLSGSSGGLTPGSVGQRAKAAC